MRRAGRCGRAAPLVAALLSLGACTAEPRPDAAPARDAPRNAAAAPTCAALAEALLPTPATRAGLRAAFGEADSVHAVTAPNRHVPGVTDSLFTVYYPGLTVGIHTPGGGGDLPDLARVEDPRWIAYPAIGIGAPADDVTAALGEPTRRETDALVYACGMGAEQPVRFHLEGGRVRRIEIDWYVD